VLATMLVGPVVAGILMTGLVSGKAGLREVGSRLLRWRVGARWYAFALLTAPLLAMVSLLALSLFSPSFLPGILVSDDKASLLTLGIAVGLGVGIFEEAGWTGFAIPALRQRRSVLGTGLILGFLWGVWHLAVYVWQSGTPTGELSPALFVPSVLFSVGVLVAFRVLMVWLYDRTASLFLAILMHASLTGGVAMILMPPGISGVPLSIFYAVFTAALWVVAAVTAGTDSKIVRKEVK